MMKLIAILPLLFLVSIPVAYADLNIEKIVQVGGTFVASDDEQDFAIGDTVVLDKSILFLSFRHIGDGNMKDWVRSYELLDTTTIRMYGGSFAPADNIQVDWEGYIVEFTSTSDVVVQKGNFEVPIFLPETEFFPPLNGSAITTDKSILIFQGFDNDNDDDTYGIEESFRSRIFNTTHLGFFVDDTPNDEPNMIRWQVADFNNANVTVQRGLGDLADGNAVDTFAPPTAINRTNSLLFVSFSQDSIFDSEPDEYQPYAILNPSNQIHIEREDSSCTAGEACTVDYAWEVIEFFGDDDILDVQHGVLVDATTTSSNVQRTSTDSITAVSNFTNSLAIGTVQVPIGLGNANPVGGGGGQYDTVQHTMELTDASTITFITEDGQDEIHGLGWQAIEFFPVVELVSVSDTFIPISCCFFFINPDIFTNLWANFILLINSAVMN